MLYYFKKSENAAEMQKKKQKEKLCAVQGEGVVTEQTCQKFHAGDFIPNNAS